MYIYILYTYYKKNKIHHVFHTFSSNSHPPLTPSRSMVLSTPPSRPLRVHRRLGVWGGVGVLAGWLYRGLWLFVTYLPQRHSESADLEMWSTLHILQVLGVQDLGISYALITHLHRRFGALGPDGNLPARPHILGSQGPRQLGGSLI